MRVGQAIRSLLALIAASYGLSLSACDDSTSGDAGAAGFEGVSCDPSGLCGNDALCHITPDATTFSGTCADSPPVQNEAVVFANACGGR